MIKEPPKLFNKLSEILKEQVPPLQVAGESENSLEVKGTKEAMQGKQKVDGYFFASLITKPKDVRFYFFPIYTHRDAFQDLSEPVQKALKGKSCFHIKKLDVAMEAEIRKIVQRGIDIYSKENLI